MENLAYIHLVLVDEGLEATLVEPDLDLSATEPFDQQREETPVPLAIAPDIEVDWSEQAFSLPFI